MARGVSRETRLLVITTLVAVAVLWLLARIRFPEGAVTPNPVQPLLTQIAPPPRFADLASEVSAARLRLGAPLFPIRVGGGREAMAVRPGLAVAWLGSRPDQPPVDAAEVVALDPLSGVGLVRTDMPGGVPLPPLWQPANLDDARYLMASDIAGDRISLRPVFIGALVPVQDAGWPAPIWLLPAHADVHAGSFVFTFNGELAGLVIPRDGYRALVPGDVLLKGTAWVEAADPAP